MPFFEHLIPTFKSSSALISARPIKRENKKKTTTTTTTTTASKPMVFLQTKVGQSEALRALATKISLSYTS